jgi:hypothetical protein
VALGEPVLQLTFFSPKNQLPQKYPRQIIRRFICGAGTFLTVHITLQKMKRMGGQALEIEKILCLMRHKRANLVQTAEQYKVYLYFYSCSACSVAVVCGQYGAVAALLSALADLCVETNNVARQPLTWPVLLSGAARAVRIEALTGLRALHPQAKGLKRSGKNARNPFRTGRVQM